MNNGIDTCMLHARLKTKKVHFESKTKKGKNPVGIYSNETNEKKKRKSYSNVNSKGFYAFVLRLNAKTATNEACNTFA